MYNNNVNIDEIRAAMAAEYSSAKEAIERANPELPPGAVAAALEARGWLHLDGRIGSCLYGFHQPEQSGGYARSLTFTDCVAFQYANGTPHSHGLVVVKDAAA